MIFNSLTFFFFLGVVHLVYSLPLSWRVRKTHLWLSSYIFYAAWNPPFVLLLWISTCVDWVAGQRIHRARKKEHKRLFLVLSLLVNLGLLGYFKYGNFLLETFTVILAGIGINYQPPMSQLVLPVGISFYTFQSLSYSFDIYKGKLEPWSRFSDFAFFVTFFPQLVAGPIVRAADFLPQCTTSQRATATQMGWGLSLLVLGLFEKVILADAMLAPVADTVYGNVGSAGTMDAWVGVLAFSGQIFFDFSGYSLCAIGVAMTFGFVLPDNFRFPYAAIGFSDFWRRWHISLSTWLKDYLYIPLGGNRKGGLRTHVNLMITMLLGGLWHGASWTFVAWGGLHGIYLVLERLLRQWLGRMPFVTTAPMRPVLALTTFLMVAVTYVFFRAETFGDAFTLLVLMFNGVDASLLALPQSMRVIFLVGTLFVIHYAMRNSSLEALAARLSPVWRWAVPAAALIVLCVYRGGERAFIYFQF